MSPRQSSCQKWCRKWPTDSIIGACIRPHLNTLQFIRLWPIQRSKQSCADVTSLTTRLDESVLEVFHRIVSLITGRLDNSVCKASFVVPAGFTVSMISMNVAPQEYFYTAEKPVHNYISDIMSLFPCRIQGWYRKAQWKKRFAHHQTISGSSHTEH